MSREDNAVPTGPGYPRLTPREDRLLLHWYPENVRDLESNRDYLRLPIEAKGVLMPLRHLFLHGGLLPNDPEVLAWQARESHNVEAFRRGISAILESRMFVATPDGKYIFDPVLDEEIRDAAQKVKTLKKAGSKGGKNKGKSGRDEKGDSDPGDEGGGASPIPF